jgi:hypothetical protein
MKKNGSRGILILHFIVIIIFLTSYISHGPSPLYWEATAGNREFDIEAFDENISIAPFTLESIDIAFQEGCEFEVIFTLQVKENLPIDVWFMNEDNYLLLTSNAQFLFYIDGSEEQVTYTKNIVSLTEHDLYKLVMANYNNQTVVVNVVYEIRTYYDELGENSSDDSVMLFYSLFIIVVLLVIFLIVFILKNRRYKLMLYKINDKAASKKSKTRKPKKKRKKHKTKKSKPKSSEKTSSRKSEVLESEEPETKETQDVSRSYCGHCGKPVSTPYCIHCGRKV